MAREKNKTFFVEWSAFSFLVAQTVKKGEALVVEKVYEAPGDDLPAVKSLLLNRIGPSMKGGYLRACCGVYPAERLLRLLSIEEPRKARDPAVMEGLIKNQFHIDPQAFVLAPLHPQSGSPLDTNKGSDREIFLCGAPQTELEAIQGSLIETDIYPTRLELGSVATLGSLLDYMAFAEIETPVIVLELGLKDTHVFILSQGNVALCRVIPYGLHSLVGVVQRELGLKDEKAAWRLFYSDTFDFKEMGVRLIDRLLRELHSLTGFYEVQTGQSVGQVLCTLIPGKLSWLNRTFAKSLGVNPVEVQFTQWLKSRNIECPEEEDGEPVPSHWIGLFSLMLQPTSHQDEKKQ